jgi:predicted metal-dependent hydrolase
VEELRIAVDGVNLKVLVERKRVKNLNARLQGRTVRVSAPLHVPRGEIEAAIPGLARTLLRRERAREINSEEDALKLVRRVAARFPNPPVVRGVAFVTNQRSCWGSYSPRTRTIHLHAGLRTMPRWVLEAIVAHELAHTVHLRHTRAFWTLLRSVCPATDRARAFLEGVSWLAGGLDRLPPVERALLVRGAGGDADVTS